MSGNLSSSDYWFLLHIFVVSAYLLFTGISGVFLLRPPLR